MGIAKLRWKAFTSPGIEFILPHLRMDQVRKRLLVAILSPVSFLISEYNLLTLIQLIANDFAFDLTLLIASQPGRIEDLELFGPRHNYIRRSARSGHIKGPIDPKGILFTNTKRT